MGKDFIDKSLVQLTIASLSKRVVYPIIVHSQLQFWEEESKIEYRKLK